MPRYTLDMLLLVLRLTLAQFNYLRALAFPSKEPIVMPSQQELQGLTSELFLEYRDGSYVITAVGLLAVDMVLMFLDQAA